MSPPRRSIIDSSGSGSPPSVSSAIPGIPETSATGENRGVRLENVQALRGVAVLLVMMFHLHGLESLFVRGAHLLPSACGIGRGGVDLFFVISGLVMVVSTHGRWGGLRTGGRFLLRRILRIYPLYWLYSLATLSVFLLPAGQVSDIWRQADLSASFLLWPQEKAPLLFGAMSYRFIEAPMPAAVRRRLRPHT